MELLARQVVFWMNGVLDRTPHANDRTHARRATVMTVFVVHMLMSAVSCPSCDSPAGGPGGSSLIGGLTENGPLFLSDDSFDASFNATGVPTLFHRPQRWNRLANMVYVETPATTGFSYCDRPCAWNDSSTADAHYQMTLAFFDAFPEYHGRELYFTGESYAGARQHW